MNNDYNFEGKTFTQDEMEKLKGIARASIGSEIYETFFDVIFNDAVPINQFLSRFHGLTKNDKYIVCPDNRALNLINLLYRAHYAQKHPCLEEKLYANGAYWAEIPSICEKYDKCGALPYTCYIGDLFIYGSNLIDIQKITGNYIFDFIKMSQDVKRDAVLEKYKESNKILVYRGLCLDSECITAGNSNLIYKLYTTTNSRSNWTASESFDAHYIIYWALEKIRETLYREHVFSNSNISLSLYEGNKSDNIHELFAKAAAKYNFVSYKRATKIKLEEEYYIRPLKDGNGNIFAFYTLTVYQNSFKDGYIITPHIIMADFKYQKGTIPLFDNYKSEYANMEFLDKNKAEALYLILNYNLLLLLEKECGQKVITNDRMDIDKIRFSFKADKNNDLIGELLKYKEPLWNIKQMDDFILSNTISSQPLFSHINSSDVKTNINPERILEDILINKAIDNYSKFSRFIEKIYSPLNEKILLSDLFDEVKNLGVQNDHDVIKVMGEFLYLTNFGVVDADLDRDKDKNTYQYICKIK